jgi:hypothetical protein
MKSFTTKEFWENNKETFDKIKPIDVDNIRTGYLGRLKN